MRSVYWIRSVRRNRWPSESNLGKVVRSLIGYLIEMRAGGSSENDDIRRPMSWFTSSDSCSVDGDASRNLYGWVDEELICVARTFESNRLQLVSVSLPNKLIIDRYSDLIRCLRGV